MKPITRLLVATGVVCLIITQAIPAQARLKPALEHKQTKVKVIRRPVGTPPVSLDCVCPRAGGAVGPLFACTSADRSCDNAATGDIVELCDTDSLCEGDYSWALCRSGKRINLSYPVSVIVDDSCDTAGTDAIELCLTDELCGGARCECFNSSTGITTRTFDCTGWPVATEPTLNAVRPCGTIRFLSSGMASIQLCARPELTTIFDPNCEVCKCPGGGLEDCDEYPPNRACDNSTSIGVAELCSDNPQCQSPVMCHCPTIGATMECTGMRVSDMCDNPATERIELCAGTLDEYKVCCGCLCPGETRPEACASGTGTGSACDDPATPCLIEMCDTDPECSS